MSALYWFISFTARCTWILSAVLWIVCSAICPYWNEKFCCVIFCIQLEAALKKSKTRRRRFCRNTKVPIFAWLAWTAAIQNWRTYFKAIWRQLFLLSKLTQVAALQWSSEPGSEDWQKSTKDCDAKQVWLHSKTANFTRIERVKVLHSHKKRARKNV